MKAKWLIVATGRDEDNERICQAARDLGREVRKVSIKDVFEGTNLYSADDPAVVVYGSVWSTEHITKTYPWITWMDLESTTCSAYYPRFGQYLMQDPYHMLPLGDLRRMWDYLYSLYGEDEHLFVRPNENDKAFTAKCITKRDCIYFDRAGQPENMIVVVSRPKRITIEYRLFMHHKKFLTGSIYKVEGQLLKSDVIPPAVIEFAEKAAAQGHYEGLPPVWVMDVAELLDAVRPYRVLEVSGSCCAGFYAADHNKIIAAISAEADTLLSSCSSQHTPPQPTDGEHRLLPLQLRSE